MAASRPFIETRNNESNHAPQENGILQASANGSQITCFARWPDQRAPLNPLKGTSPLPSPQGSGEDSACLDDKTKGERESK